MKPRNLIILAVVVIAVASYIFFYERHQMTSDEARERAGKVFPDFDRDAVQEIEIHNSHGNFQLVKSDDHWQLTAPIDFPADSTAVSSLLDSLNNLDVERRLGADEVDPGAYGLDEPEMRVVAQTDLGDRFEIVVGEETPLGSNRAVQRKGEPEIILCSRYFVSNLDKELADWRSRDVVDVVADDVASIQVVTASDRIHAVRDDDAWRLLEPISDLADRDHMRNLISNFNGLRIEEFLDGEVSPAEYGLDDPSYRVTLIRTAGADPIQLDFGLTREEDGTTQVACRRNGTEYFWVDDLAATRLAKAPVTWRSPKVYPFDTWDAERLTITSGGQEIALDRAEGLWKLPDGGELDYTAVQDRLTTLANLEVREYDLIEPGTDAMGRIELELKAAADDDEAEPGAIDFTFFRPLTEGGDAIVITSARDTIMSVDPGQVETLLADPSSLRKPDPEPEETEAAD